MNKAIIDTDIFSEMTKGVDPVVAANAMAYRSAFGIYCISAVTFMEIVRGYQKKQASRQLQAFLTGIANEAIVPFGQAEAELAGKISGELQRVGRPIGITDPMIAATAIAHGLELVTGNTLHFQQVQQLGYPLSLVNWRA